MPYANTEAMNLHLEEISKAVAPGAHAALVFDGAGWHGSEELKIPDNITPIILPPYSPELNPAENIWEYFRQNHLSNRLYETYDDFEMLAAMLGMHSWPRRNASLPSRSGTGQKCHKFWPLVSLDNTYSGEGAAKLRRLPSSA